MFLLTLAGKRCECYFCKLWLCLCVRSIWVYIPWLRA